MNPHEAMHIDVFRQTRPNTDDGFELETFLIQASTNSTLDTFTPGCHRPQPGGIDQKRGQGIQAQSTRLRP